MFVGVVRHKVRKIADPINARNQHTKARTFVELLDDPVTVKNPASLYALALESLADLLFSVARNARVGQDDIVFRQALSGEPFGLW